MSAPEQVEPFSNDATVARAPRAAQRGAAPYAGWVLVLLFAVNVLNYIDRVIVGVLVEPIKRELLLSDTQLSLISGFSFVLFHLAAGLYIARAVDRGNRRLILFVGVALWSAATAATGFANNFFVLVVCRLFVGVGEATAFPVAISLIGDLFDDQRRPRSIAVFQSSSYVGVVSGGIVAGLIAARWGWRAVFFVCGVAGLALALLALVTLRETPRRQALGGAVCVSSLALALTRVARVPGFVLTCLGYGFPAMATSSMSAWGPAFFMRTHAVSIAQAGPLTALTVGVGGVTGALCAGVIAGRLVRKTGLAHSALLVPIVALLFATPFMCGITLLPSFGLALLSAGIGNLFLASILGPTVAAAFSAAPVDSKALASNLLLIAQVVIGAGCGPLIVGIVSDGLAPAFGADSLRMALTSVMVAPLFGALFLYLGCAAMRTARQ